MLFFLQRLSLRVLVFVFVLLLWGGICRFGNFPASLLPHPLTVARAILELAASGNLGEHAIASLLRVLMGFSLAALCAVPLGLILGWHREIRSACFPLISMLRTVSPLAWVPLAVLWFGIGERPAVFVIFIAAFFPILLATIFARDKIDPLILKVAANYEMRSSRLLTSVLLPASFPYIVVGMRIALGFSWVVIVAAEMVGMRSGLGYLILDARNSLRTEMILAGMVIVGIIGIVLDSLMERMENYAKRTHLGGIIS